MLEAFDYLQKAKLAALDAAIKIESMSPNNKGNILAIDMKALPTNFDHEEFIETYRRGEMPLLVNSKSEEPKIIDLTIDLVIKRADIIYNWLIMEK